MPSLGCGGCQVEAPVPPASLPTCSFLSPTAPQPADSSVCLCVLSCLPRDLLAEGAGSRPEAGRISDPNSIKHDAGGGHTIVQVRLRYDELPPTLCRCYPILAGGGSAHYLSC